MKRIFKQTHKPIKFKFRQSKDDFVVTEIPLFDTPTDKGNYFIAKVQKQDLSTMELLDILEHDLQCFSIGYQRQRTAIISHSSASDTSKYDRLVIRNVEVDVIDDDTPDLIIHGPINSVQYRSWNTAPHRGVCRF